MVKKEMECSSGSTDCGRSSDVGNALAVVENGFFRSDNSGGSSEETLRTYKRRKCTKMNSSQAKVLENGNISVDTFRQFTDKTSLQTCEHVDKFRSLGGVAFDRTHKSGRGPLGVTCNGSSCKSSCSNTDLCGQVFLDIVKSEEFTQLCDILWENFQGAKMDSLRDIHCIKAKIKEEAYENSPMLFHSDMQKVWEHLQKVGTDLVSLSKSLMDKSKASFSQQFPDSNFSPKLEETEACDIPNACTCRHCGEKAEGYNSLVCDSCEGIYHVSCIEPAIEEIPTKSWYCINCIAIGIESPHKLIVTLPSYEDTNGLSNYEIELRKGGNICNICKTEVLSCNQFKICAHSECPHRYYHMNCLTIKQLSTYGPWYCPSCLCRVCLSDRDDHEIVLCDGCDNAYHIYCMQPPLISIPNGNWFCVKCDADIQKIAKARRGYERIQIKVKKRREKGKGIVDEEIGSISGGVDMLLSAARTLKHEEFDGEMES